MKAMTEQNLINAFGGESMAHMRYLKFGDIAEKENFPNVARLFRSIAFAEEKHAHHHYQNLSHLDGGRVANPDATFGPGNTKKNLGLAMMGEQYEVEEMYPAFIEVAKMQGEEKALRGFQGAYEAEKVHYGMFKKALSAVELGKDLEIGTIRICSVCGWTLEGDAPDTCPICGVSKEKFVAY